jgi:hypothetical protein
MFVRNDELDRETSYETKTRCEDCVSFALDVMIGKVVVGR